MIYAYALLLPSVHGIFLDFDSQVIKGSLPV